MRVCQRAKTQRVQRKHRSGSHCKNIANDPAYSRRGPLKRLDGTRMIVRFHLKRYGPSIANIDDACVFFAGFDQHARASRREFPQLSFGVFVRTMFAPHHGENAEFGKIRVAPEDALDAEIFVRRNTVFGDDFWGDLRIGRHISGPAWSRKFAVHHHYQGVSPWHDPDAA